MWLVLSPENIMQQLPHSKEGVSITSPDVVHYTICAKKKGVLASIKDIKGLKGK